MCIDYVGRCACSCGCNAELERHAVCVVDAGDENQGCKGTFPIYYNVFDYRCQECWPWSPASVSWSRRRRGEYWWYVPLWKRWSIELISVGCARIQNNANGDRIGDCLPGASDDASMELFDLREGEATGEDIVTQIYRHLESLYGDNLSLGPRTIAELEMNTGKQMDRVTIYFPPVLRGVPLKIRVLKRLQ